MFIYFPFGCRPIFRDYVNFKECILCFEVCTEKCLPCAGVSLLITSVFVAFHTTCLREAQTVHRYI